MTALEKINPSEPDSGRLFGLPTAKRAGDIFRVT